MLSKAIKVKTFFGSSGPYMTVRLIKWRGVSICLHQIHRSDEDEDCHDHPFDFWSLILRGGYWEHQQNGARTWHGPCSFLRRKAEDRHRLELKPGLTAWTLCIKFARNPEREWGFWRGETFIPWRQYIKSKGLALNGDAS